MSIMQTKYTVKNPYDIPFNVFERTSGEVEDLVETVSRFRVIRKWQLLWNIFDYTDSQL